LDKWEFNPPIFAAMFNPLFLLRRSLRAEILGFSGEITGKVLDFGCGSKPYLELFAQATDYVGVDLIESVHPHEGINADYFYDGKTLPFPDSTFDGIVCFEVLEHVFNVDEILLELYRVTKPAGKILISVPFVFREHEKPFDFARYTSFGLQHILLKSGFLTLQTRKTTNSLTTVLGLSAEQMETAFSKWGPIAWILLPIPLTVLNIVGLASMALWSRKHPDNHHDVFLNLLVLAQKV
jgi:SAM-dependent methyltransferase